jgi:DNA-directed RNA polymerase specialized sigma24 family protein
MSGYQPSTLVCARLLQYFAGQTGDRAQSHELARQTLLRLHEAHTDYATDSDVLPWALEIARDLVVDARRRTRC